jgi:hypothetical protein
MFISLSLSLKKNLGIFCKTPSCFCGLYRCVEGFDDGFDDGFDVLMMVLFASFSQSDDLIITTMVSSREEECYLFFVEED